MYRFDKIWVTSYLTNIKVKDLITNHTAADGTTPLTASELSGKTFELGQLLGQQFKFWFYAKNLTQDKVPYDYVYPIENMTMENITLDQLDYPTNDLNEEWVGYLNLTYV